MGTFRSLISMLIFFASINFIYSTGIDCEGRGFYCNSNTTFLICVDTGNYKTFTVDDDTQNCPSGTFCSNAGQFECDSNIYKSTYNETTKKYDITSTTKNPLTTNTPTTTTIVETNTTQKQTETPTSSITTKETTVKDFITTEKVTKYPKTTKSSPIVITTKKTSPLTITTRKSTTKQNVTTTSSPKTTTKSTTKSSPIVITTKKTSPAIITTRKSTTKPNVTITSSPKTTTKSTTKSSPIVITTKKTSPAVITTRKSTIKPNVTTPKPRCEPSKYYPDETSCHYYYVCIGRTLEKFYCPFNTVFDPVERRCSHDLKDCPSTFQCKSTGKFVDKRMCQAYFECVKLGTQLSSLRRICPFFMSYVSTEKRCVSGPRGCSFIDDYMNQL